MKPFDPIGWRLLLLLTDDTGVLCLTLEEVPNFMTLEAGYLRGIQDFVAPFFRVRNAIIAAAVNGGADIGRCPWARRSGTRWVKWPIIRRAHGSSSGGFLLGPE
jgi:hypothetical protein